MPLAKKKWAICCMDLMLPTELKKIRNSPISKPGLQCALAKQQIDQMLRMKKGTAEQIEQRNQLITFINYHEAPA